MQKIILLNNKNQKLVGYYYPQKSDSLMIFCHGTESFSNNIQTLKPFIKEYLKMDFSLFLFDFTGYGKSEGKGVFNHSQRVADIGSALEHFKGRYKKIILCGISAGCICSAIAATKYKVISKLCLVNGYYNLLLTHPKFYIQTILGYLLSQEIRKETIFAWKNLHPKNIKVPTLIVAGLKDQVVSPKQSINLYNQLTCDKKLILVPDGDHALVNQKYISEYFPELKDWLIQ